MSQLSCKLIKQPSNKLKIINGNEKLPVMEEKILAEQIC